MADYNVWIIDPLEELLDAGLVPVPVGGRKTVTTHVNVAVAHKLNDWFDPIAKRAGFDRAKVYFPRFVVTPLPHEMLIYLCPSMTSVVQNKPGVDRSSFPNPRSSPHQGVTAIGALTGSEVWLKIKSVEAVASLIFHEAMHNKLQVGNNLHTRFLRCRLSCARISWPTSPSDLEIAAMATALRNPVPQWTDGQGILRAAKQAKDRGDPLWDAAIRER